MDVCRKIADTSDLLTPALVVFHDLLEENIERMVRIAGDPARLRPHCKTHKMGEVIRIEVSRGIRKHKAATFAEAEMLVGGGVNDVLLAYPVVGANVARAVQFVEAYPDVAFSLIADHPRPIGELGRAMACAGRQVPVLLDLDTGLHRTGVGVGPLARDVYSRLAQTQGIEPGGLHLYDGENHQTDVQQRRTAVEAVWRSVSSLRDELRRAGYPVPRVVAGTTASFPIFAAVDDPSLEVCPGTCVFQDVGYGELFPDLEFVPAAWALTRVISRPTPDRITFDLGYKAVACDAPLEKRVIFPDIPDARIVLQNEEHLVVHTPRAGDFQPGDALLAIPYHICPTSALHQQVYVVREGRVVDRWEVTARDRRLTI